MTSKPQIPRSLLAPPLKVHRADEAEQARKRAMYSDRAFKLEMLAARRNKRESFTLGVVTAAATQHPRCIPHGAVPTGRNAGPAALCADAGDADRRVQTAE
jgi:hypothetical protein